MHLSEHRVDASDASVSFCIGLATTRLKLLSLAPTPRPVTGAGTSQRLRRTSPGASGATTDVTCLVATPCDERVPVTAVRSPETHLKFAPTVGLWRMAKPTSHTQSNFVTPMPARTKCSRRISPTSPQVCSSHAYLISRRCSTVGFFCRRSHTGTSVRLRRSAVVWYPFMS